MPFGRLCPHPAHIKEKKTGDDIARLHAINPQHNAANSGHRHARGVRMNPNFANEPRELYCRRQETLSSTRASLNFPTTTSRSWARGHRFEQSTNGLQRLRRVACHRRTTTPGVGKDPSNAWAANALDPHLTAITRRPSPRKPRSLRYDECYSLRRQHFSSRLPWPACLESRLRAGLSRRRHGVTAPKAARPDYTTGCKMHKSARAYSLL